MKELFTEIEEALAQNDYIALMQILNNLDEGVRAEWLLGVVETLANWQQQAKKQPPTLLGFDEWKAEFVPVIYEDTGAWCEEHAETNNANPAQWCECEYLYSFELDELREDETHANALNENRVWTWHEDGAITSGPTEGKALLVTAKPYTNRMEIR